MKAFGAFLELRAAKAAVDSLGAVSNGLQTASQSANLFGVSLGKALGIIGAIVWASYEIVTHWKEITQWAENAGKAITNIDTSKITSAKAGTLPRDDNDYGISVMTSTYMPPEIKPHAKCGILTHPHIGLVAEAGPEAVIPLRDKPRGLAVLTQAMNILGVSQSPNISMPGAISNIPAMTGHTQIITADNSRESKSSSSLRNFYQGGNICNDRRLYDTSNISTPITGGHSEYIRPVVNLTVNIEGSNTETGIADRIREAVTEAMTEIFSREERLAYAL